MSACKTHRNKPAWGYSSCPGCEVEQLRKRVAELEAALQIIYDYGGDIGPGLGARQDYYDQHPDEGCFDSDDCGCCDLAMERAKLALHGDKGAVGFTNALEDRIAKAKGESQ